MAECMLTERITFEKLIDTGTNDNGFDVDIWNKIYTCWAKKEDFSGKEYIKANATQSEIVVGFTVRVCRNVLNILDSYETKKYRIVHKGNIYDIKYCHDVKNQHMFADFKCKLVR